MVRKVFGHSFSNWTADGGTDVGGHDEESHGLSGVAVGEHIGNGGGDVGDGGGARNAGEEAEDDDLRDVEGERAANVEDGKEETRACVDPSSTREIPVKVSGRII